MKGSIGKAPSIQWYIKDWLSDKNLQVCSSATRGIWMNLLMYMYDCSIDDPEACEVGILNVSAFEITRLGGCSIAEAEAFIKEAFKHKFCNIWDADQINHAARVGSIPEMDSGTSFEKCPKNVRIMSRRIFREAERRVKWRNEKRKQREKEEETEGVRKLSMPRARVPSPAPSPTPIALKNKAAFFEMPGAEMIAEASPDKIDNLINLLCEKIKEKGTFKNVKSFVSQMTAKKGINQRALLHALVRTYSKDDFKKGPWSYALKIIDVENGNYNEAESARA